MVEQLGGYIRIEKGKIDYSKGEDIISEEEKRKKLEKFLEENQEFKNEVINLTRIEALELLSAIENPNDDNKELIIMREQELETITSYEILELNEELLTRIDNASYNYVFNSESGVLKDLKITEDVKRNIASGVSLHFLNTLSSFEAKDINIKDINISVQLQGLLNFLGEKAKEKLGTINEDDVKKSGIEKGGISKVANLLSDLDGRLSQILKSEGVGNMPKGGEKNKILMNPLYMMKYLEGGDEIKFNAKEELTKEQLDLDIQADENLKGDIKKMLSGIEKSGILDQLGKGGEALQDLLNNSNPYLVEYLKKPTYFKKIITFLLDLFGIDLDQALEKTSIKQIGKIGNKIIGENKENKLDFLQKFFDKGVNGEAVPKNKDFWKLDKEGFVMLEEIKEVLENGNDEIKGVGKGKLGKPYSRKCIEEILFRLREEGKITDFASKYDEKKSAGFFKKTLDKLLKLPNGKYKKKEQDKKEEAVSPTQALYANEEENNKNGPKDEQSSGVQDDSIDEEVLTPPEVMTEVINSGSPPEELGNLA